MSFGKPFKAKPRKSTAFRAPDTKSIGRTGSGSVTKIRRSRNVAYGTPTSWNASSELCLSMAGRRCALCGRGSAAGNRLQAHHIIPVSRGGRTTQANLKCLCESCHSRQPGHGHLNVKKVSR